MTGCQLLAERVISSANAARPGFICRTTAALALAVTLFACQGDGALSIRFSLPGDAALSPVDDRLAEITLVATRDDDGRTLQTRDVIARGAPIDMGLLPAGSRVRLAVELRSPTQRLIGYGQSAGEIEVVAGQATDVEIEVRRPFVYLAGQASRLEIYDPTLDPSDAYATAVALDRPRAVAPSADGTEVVVVSEGGAGGLVRLLSTFDHALTRPQVGLPRPPRDVAISADGATAVVGHDGADGGLSLIDLAALREGAAVEPTFLALGAVGAVGVTGEGDEARAIALLDRAAGPCGVAASSSLVTVSLAEPDAAVVVALPAPAFDLAVTDAGAVIVADGCGDRLATVAADGSLATLAELPGAGAVAAVGAQLWGAGVAPPTALLGRRIALLRAEGDGEPTRLELPPAQERIESIEFTGADQAVEVAIDADELGAVELAALPGADLVALTTRGYYHSQESGSFGGLPVVPEMEITTHEYTLIDASTRSVVQRMRTFCDGFLLSDAVLTEFVCAIAPDQDTLPFEEGFEPSQIAVLYGGR